jgi:hypothetical protein
MPRATRGSGAPRRSAEPAAAPPEPAAVSVRSREETAPSQAVAPPPSSAPVPSPERDMQPTVSVAQRSQRAPRFRIFIVDTGWDSPAHRVLIDNFWLIRELQKDDPIYVLGRDKSIDYMRYHQARIGHDPIIAVHDLAAINRQGTSDFHGFRLRLGLLKTNGQALMALQNFCRFLISHRESTRLEADIRADLRREGVMGAIEIVFEYEAREIGA